MKIGFSKLVLATSALTLISLTVSAQSGEGRNGPDRSGVSIPVKVDRLVDEGVFEQIKNGCLIQQADLVIDQIFRQNLTPTQHQQIRNGGVYVYSASGNAAAGGRIGFQPGNQYPALKTDFERLASTQLANLKASKYLLYELSDATIEALLNSSHDKDGFEHSLALSLDVYSVRAKEPRYDEFGSAVSNVIESYSVSGDGIVRNVFFRQNPVHPMNDPKAIVTAFRADRAKLQACIGQSLNSLK